MSEDDVLFERIKDHLQEQAKNGGRIDTEVQLAERFGVTRYRIRKVLDVLTQMGILIRSPKRGTRVREVGESALRDQIQKRFDIANFDIQEYLEARVLIECALMPIVARRLTPQNYSRLEALLRKIRDNADDPKVADEADRNFHLLLLECCGNRVLQVFSSVLVAYFERTSDRVSELDREFFLDVAKKEGEILKALHMNDAQKAASLLKEHLLEQSGFFG